jgi:hypothetical protein
MQKPSIVGPEKTHVAQVLPGRLATQHAGFNLDMSGAMSDIPTYGERLKLLDWETYGKPSIAGT